MKDKPIEEWGCTFTWRPGLLPDPINDIVRRTFWVDHRVYGERYSAFTYHLWDKSQALDVAQQIVEIIERETSSGASLFGDGSTVPLFALLTNRSIAANEVDTNVQRYLSGNVNPQELVQKIDVPTTEMIILRCTPDPYGVAGVKEVQKLVSSKYTRIQSLPSKNHGVFHLFKRQPDGPT